MSQTSTLQNLGDQIKVGNYGIKIEREDGDDRTFVVFEWNTGDDITRCATEAEARKVIAGEESMDGGCYDSGRGSDARG